MAGDARQAASMLSGLPAPTLEEKLLALMSHAAGRTWDWEQAWKLIEPLLESPMCFRAVQWAYQLLRTVLGEPSLSTPGLMSTET